MITFKSKCIELVKYTLCDINVTVDLMERSTLGSKTIAFNSSRNSMTLTYKYTGSKFDTSYQPSVRVNKLSSSYFFSMSSYSGSFKNSNTMYSVFAKGKIYTDFGVSDGKSFTVNFSL